MPLHKIAVDDVAHTELYVSGQLGEVVVQTTRAGRVLAMVEHSEAAPGLRGLPVKAVFPAASVFKLVTASALLDEGVTPDDESCYHGGKRRVSARIGRREHMHDVTRGEQSRGAERESRRSCDDAARSR